MAICATGTPSVFSRLVFGLTIRTPGVGLKSEARSFRRRISRKFSRRPGVEVFEFYSNESRISAAK